MCSCKPTQLRNSVSVPFVNDLYTQIKFNFHKENRCTSNPPHTHTQRSTETAFDVTERWTFSVGRFRDAPVTYTWSTLVGRARNVASPPQCVNLNSSDALEQHASLRLTGLVSKTVGDVCDVASVGGRGLRCSSVHTFVLPPVRRRSIPVCAARSTEADVLSLLFHRTFKKAKRELAPISVNIPHHTYADVFYSSSAASIHSFFPVS